MYPLVVHALTSSGHESTFEGLSTESAESLVHALAVTGAYQRVWITALSLKDTRPLALAALEGS